MVSVFNCFRARHEDYHRCNPLLDAFQLRLFYLLILFTVRTLVVVIIALSRKIHFKIHMYSYFFLSVRFLSYIKFIPTFLFFEPICNVRNIFVLDYLGEIQT